MEKIERKNKEDVFEMIERIDIPKGMIIASGVYEHYGIDSIELENLSFDMDNNQ